MVESSANEYRRSSYNPFPGVAPMAAQGHYSHQGNSFCAHQTLFFILQISVCIFLFTKEVKHFIFFPWQVTITTAHHRQLDSSPNPPAPCPSPWVSAETAVAAAGLTAAEARATIDSSISSSCRMGATKGSPQGTLQAVISDGRRRGLAWLAPRHQEEDLDLIPVSVTPPYTAVITGGRYGHWMNIIHSLPFYPFLWQKTDLFWQHTTEPFFSSAYLYDSSVKGFLVGLRFVVEHSTSSISHGCYTK